MAIMSYRQYAAHRGCSVGAVQKAIGDADASGARTGRIGAAMVTVPGNPHPKIDSVKADALWLLNTDESKRSTLFAPEFDGVPPAGTSALAPPEVEPEDFIAGEDSESIAIKKSYHESRAKIAAVDLEEKQLDLEMRKGKLIPIDEAVRIGFTTLRTLRDALRNTGPRVAAQVAAMTDPFDCEQLINAELDAVLSSITVDKILAEQDDEDEDGQGD